MGAGARSFQQLSSKNALTRDRICTACFHRLSIQASRQYATASAAIAEHPGPERHEPPNPPFAATGPRKAFRVLCSPVVSRPPLLTRELTSFEKAYYFYQKRLNERLALPFTRYFYYKKGTPADVEWKRKRKVRTTDARDVGVYNAYTEDGWNDEALVGSKLGEPDDIVDKLFRDAEGKAIVDAPESEEAGGDAKIAEGLQKPVADVAIERPMPRYSEADHKNDLQSLSRKMDRSLYLLLRRKDGQWRFPEDRIYGKETLHQATERILVQAGGINMNTWVVGNHPIGHYMLPYRNPVLSSIQPNRLVGDFKVSEQEELGEKIFFMKSRIMAGQADMSKNEYGDQEFVWLAKEEIKERVSDHYWAWIKNMLSER